MSHRQWYAVRDKLRKAGKWQGKRKQPHPDPPADEDPIEGTSAGTAPPPAKQLTLEDLVKTTVSTIAGPSATALRVVSVGAQVAGTLTGNAQLVTIGTIAGIAQSFLSAADGGAGATTGNLAATALGQRSNAPTQEDLSSAPAPQLATSGDPVPNTRPEVPETEYQAGSSFQNRFYDPLGSPDQLLRDFLNEFGQRLQEEELMDWDPQDVEEMLERIENQILNVKRFLVGGDGRDPLKVAGQNPRLKLGKLVPV